MSVWRSRELSARNYAYLLNAPSFFIVFFMVVYPLLFMFYISFHDWYLLPPKQEFIGLGNYVNVLQSEIFWDSLLRTLMFTFVSVIVTVVGGLAIALVLNEEFKGRPMMRALMLVPWAIPPIANALMWKWVLHPQGFGGLNWFLVDAIHVLDQPIAWITDYAMLSVIYANAYREIPFVTIILIAALSMVPIELYDSAKVDGANIWVRFRHVTLPLIKIPLGVAILIETVWGIRVFDTVYGLTHGGPGDETTVISWLFYTVGWQAYDFGRASVISICLGLICMVIAVVYFRVYFRQVFGK